MHGLRHDVEARSLGRKGSARPPWTKLAAVGACFVLLRAPGADAGQNFKVDVLLQGLEGHSSNATLSLKHLREEHVPKEHADIDDTDPDEHIPKNRTDIDGKETKGGKSKLRRKIRRGTVDKVTSASLSKEDLAARQVVFTALFALGTALLGALGVAAVYLKRGGILPIVLGPLRVVSGKGLLWHDKVVCCGASTYKSLGDGHDDAASTAAASGGALPAATAGDDGTAADENFDEAQAKLIFKQQQEGLDANAEFLRWRSRLLWCLFGGYVVTSVGIPIGFADKASCSQGFFWEEHLPFFGLCMLTKLAELGLYTFDDTIRGDLDVVTFAMKFFPSFLGYVDGYTDATAIAIARSCTDNEFAQKLAISMTVTYICGVVVNQWIVVAYLASKDETHACLMKLLHFDALSSCISIPDDTTQRTWKIVNMARSLGEDIPQAVQQSLFLLYVKRNPFMMLSVMVSIASSMKALYDAIHRRPVALGAHLGELEKAVLALEAAYDSVQKLDKKSVADMYAKYPQQPYVVLTTEAVKKLMWTGDRMDMEIGLNRLIRKEGDEDINILHILRSLHSVSISYVGANINQFEPHKTLRDIKEYTDDPGFRPEAVGAVSVAAGVLCAWVHAVKTHAEARISSSGSP